MNNAHKFLKKFYLLVAAPESPIIACIYYILYLPIVERENWKICTSKTHSFKDLLILMQIIEKVRLLLCLCQRVKSRSYPPKSDPQTFGAPSQPKTPA